MSDHQNPMLVVSASEDDPKKRYPPTAASNGSSSNLLSVNATPSGSQPTNTTSFLGSPAVPTSTGSGSGAVPKMNLGFLSPHSPDGSPRHSQPLSARSARGCGGHTPRSRLLQSLVAPHKCALDEDAEDENFILGDGMEDSSSMSGSFSSHSSAGLDASSELGHHHHRSQSNSFYSRRPSLTGGAAAAMGGQHGSGMINDSLLSAAEQSNPSELHRMASQAEFSASMGDHPHRQRDESNHFSSSSGKQHRHRHHHKHGWKHTLHPKIPKRHQHSMSPFHKAYHYKRVPCKLLLNIILLTLMCVQVFMFDIHRSYADEHERRKIIEAFMPSGFLSARQQDYYTRPTFFFFQTSSVVDHFASTVDLYYGLTGNDPANIDFFLKAEYSVDDARRIMDATRRAEHVPDGFFVNDELVQPPTMTTVLRRKSERLEQNEVQPITRTNELTPAHPYGPFDLAAKSASKFNISSANLFHTGCAPRKDPQSGEYYLPCRTRALHRTVFDNVNSVTIALKIHQITQSNEEKGIETIYIWNINLMYDFNADGLCILTIHVGASSRGEVTSVLTPTIIVSAFIIITAFWDLLLRFKVLVRLHRYRRQMRHRFRQRVVELKQALREEAQFTSTSSSDNESNADGEHHHHHHHHGEHHYHHVAQTRLRKRLNRFQSKWKESLRNDMGRGWAQFALLADVLALAFGILDISEQLKVQESEEVVYTRSILLGISSLCVSSHLLSYMRFFPRLYFMIRATSGAIPHLGYFVIGTAPIFISFALFATAVFGSYAPQFSSFGKTCIALYSSMYGDSLLQMFQVAGATDSVAILWTSRIFSVCFIGFFMWLVLNVALAIVVDSYIHVREKFGLWETKKQEQLRMGVVGGGEVSLLMNRSKEQVKLEALHVATMQLRVALNAIDNMDGDSSESSSDDDKHRHEGHNRSHHHSHHHSRVASPRHHRPAGREEEPLPQIAVDEYNTQQLPAGGVAHSTTTSTPTPVAIGINKRPSFMGASGGGGGGLLSHSTASNKHSFFQNVMELSKAVVGVESDEDDGLELDDDVTNGSRLQ